MYNYSAKHKGVFERSFSKKDLGEAAYILSIKIYRDRSRCLISFFQWVHTLTRFWSSSKWNSERRSSCLCCKVWSWVRLKTRPWQKIEREWKVIPYASVIGSIKCAMLWTRSIVYPTLILAREYNSDLGVDHWTTVKIFLSGIRICFSIMEVIKEFVVKVTSVQTFTLIQMTLSLNLDTYWKWEQLARVAPCRAL